MPGTCDKPPASAADFLDTVRAARFAGGLGCVRCGAAAVCRWGRSGGRQRYRCRACRRTFSDLTATPLAYTKRLEAWPAFMTSMRRSGSDCQRSRSHAQTPPAETAPADVIHPRTALRWRHKVLYALLAEPVPLFGGEVAACRVLHALSHKGSAVPGGPGRTRGGLVTPGVPCTSFLILVADDGRAAAIEADTRMHWRSLSDLLASRLLPGTILTGLEREPGPLPRAARRAGLHYRLEEETNRRGDHRTDRRTDPRTGNDHGTERGTERGTETGTDHGTERGTERGTETGTDHGTELEGGEQGEQRGIGQHGDSWAIVLARMPPARRHTWGLRLWLRRFRGVATRQLPGYIAWYEAARRVAAAEDAEGAWLQRCLRARQWPP
jgi:transposase-like protein